MYVTIEGIDGSGTTSVTRRVVNGLPPGYAVPTAEPNDRYWTGEAVRTALKRDTAPTTDLFLFLADRAEHLETIVKPMLDDDRTVVSDRGADSTYAYQPEKLEGLPTGNVWEWFDELYAPWNMQPDLTILLDVSAETGLERADGDEKYEDERLERVTERYRELAERYSHRFAVINAERPLDEVATDAIAVVRRKAGLPLEQEHKERLTALEAANRLPTTMEVP